MPGIRANAKKKTTEAERPHGGGKAGMEIRKGGNQAEEMAKAAAARQAIKEARENKKK